MADILAFSLPGTPPNDNATRRWHWARRGRVAREWKQAAWAAALAARQAGAMAHVDHPFPWSRVAVAYTFVYPDRRRRDPDNRLASGKPILDGVVAAGIIADDSDKVVASIAVLPPVVGDHREVRVTITRLD